MKCFIRRMTTHRWSMAIVHGCRRSSCSVINSARELSIMHTWCDGMCLDWNRMKLDIHHPVFFSLSLSPLSQMMRVMPRSRSEQFNVEVEKEVNLLDVFDNLDMLLVGWRSDNSRRAFFNTYRRRACDWLTDWLPAWHGGYTPII